jgi:adenosylmethionine---8-amino-7-oxononanoate aminotransferase
MDGAKGLSERDQKVIWHPFTQMLTSRLAIPIVRAKGAYLYAEDGTAYLDAISSWWVNLHGHAHPYIATKIADQTGILEHVMFAGFTHLPAIELGEKLTSLTGMDKIFYSDNGSTAIETALKMALQYWYNCGEKRTKFLSLKDGYYGETFGAMSASGKNHFNQPFWDHLFAVESLNPPFIGQEERFLNTLQNILSTGRIAAFIFEPLILGPGGMKTYSKHALDLALQLCKEKGVLTIADEVMTGFGRTGPLFACDILKQKPDILCLSKGITGGFLPLGATLCKQEIYDAFLSPSLSKAFLHGHFYAANPLACTAALASLELLLKETCQTQREIIASSHRKFCQKFQSHPALVRSESLGTILILEYKSLDSPGYFSSVKDRLYGYFLDQKLLIRPFGNTVHVIPPYCMTQEELEQIYNHLAITIENHR